MVLLDGAAAPEEGDDEHDDAHDDEHDRPGRVEAPFRQVDVGRRVVLRLGAGDQDYQPCHLWGKNCQSSPDSYSSLDAGLHLKFELKGNRANTELMRMF